MAISTGAVADYSQVLQIDPNLATLHANWPAIPRLTSMAPFPIHDNAVRIDGKNALAFFNRGLIRMQKDDIDGAIIDSTHALELDPRLFQSYHDRGLWAGWPRVRKAARSPTCKPSRDLRHRTLTPITLGSTSG